MSWIKTKIHRLMELSLYAETIQDRWEALKLLGILQELERGVTADDLTRIVQGSKRTK